MVSVDVKPHVSTGTQRWPVLVCYTGTHPQNCYKNHFKQLVIQTTHIVHLYIIIIPSYNTLLYITWLFFCKAETTHVSTKIAQRYSVHKGTLRSHNYVMRTLHNMSPGVVVFPNYRIWFNRAVPEETETVNRVLWQCIMQISKAVPMRDHKYARSFSIQFITSSHSLSCHAMRVPIPNKRYVYQPWMINDYQSAGLCNYININHNWTEGVIWLCYE